LTLTQHYDYVIVDYGGQDNLALRAAMPVADHVIIPLRPKRQDLKKSNNKTKGKKSFTVDEFIADAEDYANVILKWLVKAN